MGWDMKTGGAGEDGQEEEGEQEDGEWRTRAGREVGKDASVTARYPHNRASRRPPPPRAPTRASLPKERSHGRNPLRRYPAVSSTSGGLPTI